MIFRNAILGIVTVLGLVISPAKDVFAQIRLGLHVTQEELNIWKQRAASGPYKSAGDVSTNSPGDWTRIQSNASSFIANPSAERWSGQPAGSCWSALSNPPALPGRNWAERQRDAAFVYLLTGNTTYRNAVLNELLAQASVAGTDFGDSTRWNITTGCATGDGWSWQITQWLRKLLYAYDYIRSSISASDRTTLDTWFNNAATFWETNIQQTVSTYAFPNRLSDNYTTLAASAQSCLSPRVTHYGGFTHCSFHESWNNRNGSHVLFFGLSSIVTGNATLQDRAKRFFREWVTYANFADGTNHEFDRWQTGFPGLGWSYAGVMIAEMATLADAFARTGDTSLYTFSTSSGLGTATPAGGPKSLLQIMTLYMRFVDGSVTRYGTDQAGNNGNPSYRIRSIDALSGDARNNDTWLAVANVFYRDSYIESVYRRTASGAPAYPASPTSGGYCVWCGEWGTLPGVLFMFGQMEGKVSPYGGTTPPAPPPESSSGPVTVDSTYPGYNIAPIDDGAVNATGGTATTWASAESTIDPHWITITFSSPKQLNTATIYWAYNNSRQTYMTSQQVDFQYWNGSTFQTAGSFTYTADMSSSTIIFPAVTTSQIRFHQPANKGNPQYTTVLWVTEVDYGTSTLQSPAAPGLLTVSQ